jgi:hypothetical protein
MDLIIMGLENHPDAPTNYKEKLKMTETLDGGMLATSVPWKQPENRASWLCNAVFV